MDERVIDFQNIFAHDCSCQGQLSVSVRAVCAQSKMNIIIFSYNFQSTPNVLICLYTTKYTQISHEPFLN